MRNSIRFYLIVERAELLDLKFLIKFRMNWGMSKMMSGKTPGARNSRLHQVSAKDRDAKRPLGEEERSLDRKTTGELCHRRYFQVKWLGLADNPAQKRVPKEEILLLEVCKKGIKISI